MENRIGFGPRLGAYLLDVVFIAIISMVIVTVFGITGAAAGAAAGADETTAVIGMAGGFLGGMMASMIVINIVILLWFLLEGFTGYSVGKLIVGIQIGDQSGNKANTGKLLGRYLLKNISAVLGALAVLTGMSFLNWLWSLLGFVILIGFFFVLGVKRQAFHDMIAKTAVYKRSYLK